MKSKISVLVLMCFMGSLCCLNSWAQADEAKIWKNEEAYMEFLKKGDLEGMVAFWHEDGVGWPMATPQPFSNMESRRAYLEGLFAQTKVVTLKINPVSIKIFRDVAVVHYLVDWVIQDSEGNQENKKTRITHTWMKQDGKWKIIGGMSAD
jgi:ketosteroid isomerase-like protein